MHVTETNLKRLHTIKFQIYDIQERVYYGQSEKISVYQGLGVEGGINRWSTEDFQGSETTLYDTVMADTSLSICQNP